jgi:hypothetical protein
MKKNIILIDYENVQKHDLRPLLAHDVLIKVFHGENQKFSADFLKLALEFDKTRFELVQIKGQGKNAADFHIAYFIGKLSKEIPDAFFHIISKDTGFKVLVDFLNQRQGISCRVESSIADMPMIKPVLPVTKPNLPLLKPVAPTIKPVMPTVKSVLPKTIEECYKMVVERLSNSKQPKPKKIKTLRNQIVNFCKKQINEGNANAIIQKLVDNKVIECQNESIIYR